MKLQIPRAAALVLLVSSARIAGATPAFVATRRQQQQPQQPQPSTRPSTQPPAPPARPTPPSTDTARAVDSVRARVLEGVVVTAAPPAARGYRALRTGTATRTSTALVDVPQSVSVVTAALAADQAMQSMADVARYVPGVSMGLGEGHRDAPTIRGNASTADFFVDGVRDDAQYLRDLYNAERVEALTGSNAMTFGRGGGGGVLNRVTKEAGWSPTRAMTLEGGSFAHRRATLDVGQGFGAVVAARVNAVSERSGGFRDGAMLERWGVNPTLALASGATTVRAGYERFADRRVVDRGVPSFQGRPLDAGIATFFGNPAVNDAWTNVNAGQATVEHRAGGRLAIRNRTRLADYDKFYRNSYPGAVDGAGERVALAAYDHAIRRHNLFDQLDATLDAATGPLRHTLLAGAELGRQSTSQVRQTGYFGGTATSLAVPVAAPTIGTPIAFRPSATDADNLATATASSLYAQDQLALGSRWQAIAGARWERFGVRYQDRRSARRLERSDAMLSPRVGLVWKPAAAASLYASVAWSYLPASGDQFTTLTLTTRELAPERFTNREVGAKWDVARALSLSAAAYRLDRTNTSAPDPLDPSRTVQTGAQRSAGVELAATGSLTSGWQVAGAFASQRATIVSRTAAARAGATVPLVPRTTLSLWNRYDLTDALGVGLGVVRRSRMYAAVDDAVTLPAFTRADGALFVRVTRRVRAQLNVENLLDARYWASAQGNNNLMPGAPRTLRASLATRF